MLKIRKLLVVSSLALVLPLATAANAFAATAAPVFTSATYNVGTGSLAILGSNLVATTGPNNDIDLTKVTITDGVKNSCTLTTKGEITDSSHATITLNSADEAALAKLLDKAGTTALNGGSYQINLLSGWDGTTSTTDVQTATARLTVLANSVAVLNSATYDPNTGIFTIAGTNLVSYPSTTTSDILPKYFTITDSYANSYTLTTNTLVKVNGGTSAAVTLNFADQLALQGIFNNAGTTNSAGHAYNFSAAYGWNGPLGLAALGVHPITQTASATATLNVTAATVVYGSPITAITTNKVGTIYVVPTSDTVTTSTPQTTLDAYVAGGTALKLVADPTKAISIPTKTSATNPFTLTKATDTFSVVEVNSGGLSVATNQIIINNIAAPALTATAAPGSASGSVKVAATVTTGTNDTLAYEFSPTTIATPTVGTAETIATGNPSAGSIYAYISGYDITGVDLTTNKYLAIYELNGTNVVKFKLLTLTAATIKPSSITAATVNGNTLTLTTTALNTAYVPGSSAFTVKIGSVADAVTMVAISGNSATLTLKTAAIATDTVTVAYTKPTASYLQDSSGNPVAALPASALKVSNLTGTTTTGGFTFTTVVDSMTRNTLVNVTVTAQNVTGVQVKGVAANYLSALNIWRATLIGTVSVSASDITLTASAPGAVTAIDTTKTTAVKGLLTDAYVRVFLLSSVTSGSVTSVTADGTILPYSSVDGAYEQDITYLVTVPSSVNVVLTTASGSQTVIVPVTARS